MRKKSLHAHVKHHIKYAHNHVKNHVHEHGHKWTIVIIGVAVFSLLYPYVSDASGTGDNQNQVQTGEVLSGDTQTGSVSTGDSETTTGSISSGSNESSTGSVSTGENTISTGSNESTTGSVSTGSQSTGSNESQTGSISSDNNESNTGDTQTGSVSTGDSETTTGSISSGSNESSTGSVSTGENTISTGSNESTTGSVSTSEQEENEEESVTTTGNSEESLQSSTQTGDNICNSGDISLISPASGAYYADTMSIVRTATNNDCTINDLMTIQLFDHNDQWIDIGTSAVTTTGIVFDTILLYSGMYHKTGANTSGDVIRIYTGSYTGTTTDFATGYQIRLLNTSGINMFSGEIPIFVIDNRAVTTTGITVTSDNALSGFAGPKNTVTLSFTANKVLSGVDITIADTVATQKSVNNTRYIYRVDLGTGHAEEKISYTISYTDFVQNTGTVTGTTDILFDKTSPVLTGLTLSGTIKSGVSMLATTNELTKTKIAVYASGQHFFTTMNTGYSIDHVLLLPDITAGTIYKFGLTAYDRAANVHHVKGQFFVDFDGKFDVVVNQGTGSTKDIQEFTQRSTIKIIQQEIYKFAQCKESLTYSDLAMKAGKYTLDIKMPSYNKENIKKTASAFTLVLADKIKKQNLTQEAADNLTKKFNNFLIVLKVLKDDKKACDQGLSSYHIQQFQQTLQETRLLLLK